jgi:manganese efflux pump family protein
LGIIEIILIAIGLSMDAFAVSLCKGLKMQRINHHHALVISLFFGGFQAIMPLIGWFLGSQFQKYISAFDHWIAFALLVFVGAKMVLEAVKTESEETDCNSEHLDYKELFMLAIATSIDALAVGISFAFLETRILPSVLVIGLITFGLSYLGVALGNRFGSRFKSKAELAGGIILILIGIKILLEHLGVLTFLQHLGWN